MRPLAFLVSFFLLLPVQHLFSSGDPTPVAPSGSGTSGEPYQIASVGNLYWLTQNSTAWDKEFIQTANIDVSASTGWASGAGFTPIGNGSTDFTGVYDGQGHTVNGIYINRSSEYNGMFGAVGAATIKNLGVTNVDITGGNYTAALAGYVSGGLNFEWCYTTGSVSSGDWYVAGFVGYAGEFNVSWSYSTCTVTGGDYVGGFFGYASTSWATACFSTGTVTSLRGAGGFSGTLLSSSTVEDCYTRSNVVRPSGTETSFGAFCAESQSSTVQYCYSTGSVTYTGGTDPTDKGFTSSSSEDTYANNFFDTDASGQTSGTGAAATSTANMKSLTTFLFAGWDFYPETSNGTGDYWDLDGTTTINDGYPYLRTEAGPLPVQMGAIDAQVDGGTVVLRWNTMSEVDNAGWEIERSGSQSTVDSLPAEAAAQAGRQTKAEGWVKIGFVEGAGTSTSPKTYTFTDPNPFSILPRSRNLSGRGLHFPFSISYRLKQIDRSGSFSYSSEIEVTSTAPRVFHLSQNYPNPFNPTTTISYTLDVDGPVTLKVFDLLGREVAVLVDDVQVSGVLYRVDFDARQLATGTYVVGLEAAGKRMVRRMLLVK